MLKTTQLQKKLVSVLCTFQTHCPALFFLLKKDSELNQQHAYISQADISESADP